MDTCISIIIPAFNQLEYCRQCIQSILLGTERPYMLILVDNGSTDGVSEYFDSIADATVIHSDANLGFAGGVNLGLERAEGHALLLNSDTIVPRGWLGRLEKALEQSDNIGMVGPMSNCVSGSQQIPGLAFSSLDEVNAYADTWSHEHAGQLRDVARLVGFCLLIRDTVLKEVGRFDEAYGIGNFEDDDYCLRVLRAGYRLCVAEDAFIFHYGGRTFAGMGILDDAWVALIDDNKCIFEAKWHARPEERSDALQQSRQLNHAARDAFTRGDHVEAIRLYKAAIETAPVYELNYNDFGVLLWEIDEQKGAYQNFMRALKLNPRYTEARENLMQAAGALGKTADAEAFLRDLSDSDARGGGGRS